MNVSHRCSPVVLPSERSPLRSRSRVVSLRTASACTEPFDGNGPRSRTCVGPWSDPNGDRRPVWLRSTLAAYDGSRWPASPIPRPADRAVARRTSRRARSRDAFGAQSRSTAPDRRRLTLARRFLLANLAHPARRRPGRRAVGRRPARARHHRPRRPPSPRSTSRASSSPPRRRSPRRVARLRRRAPTASTRCWQTRPLGEQVVSLRVWSPDGAIVYSPDRELDRRSSSRSTTTSRRPSTARSRPT